MSHEVGYRTTEMGHKFKRNSYKEGREGEGSGRGEALVLTWRGAGAYMSELGAELGWSPDMEASAGAGWDGGWRGTAGWKRGKGVKFEEKCAGAQQATAHLVLLRMRAGFDIFSFIPATLKMSQTIRAVSN